MKPSLKRKKKSDAVKTLNATGRFKGEKNFAPNVELSAKSIHIFVLVVL